MKPETILDVLGLGLRAAEGGPSRRPKLNLPDTRADQLVRRVLPLAERALERVTPPGPVGEKVKEVRHALRARRTRRRRSLIGTLGTVAAGALSAGAVAYIVVKEQQRIRERYRPLHVPFAPELLDVLAAPGGGKRLDFNGRALVDPATGATYALLDGLPDFIAPPASPDKSVSDEGWIQDRSARLGWPWPAATTPATPPSPARWPRARARAGCCQCRPAAARMRLRWPRPTRAPACCV